MSQQIEFIGGPLDGETVTEPPDAINIYLVGKGTDGHNRHVRYDYDGTACRFVGWVNENEELIV